MIDAHAPVEVFDEIDSTILEARRRAERGELKPVWLVAKRQTAGRGRRGRAWSSLEGNLLATYLGITQERPAAIALRGFAAGVAIAETIESMIDRGRVTLKWPNDVMLDDAKVAGIMLDSGTTTIAVPPDAPANSPGLWCWVALAFGVNLAISPEQLDQATTSISTFMRDKPPSPLELLAAIRPRLQSWDRHAKMDVGQLRDAWISRAHGLGSIATVTVGERKITGTVAGLSINGELKLETAAGVQYVSAGDVHFPNEVA